jgi:hypothetical protein
VLCVCSDTLRGQEYARIYPVKSVSRRSSPLRESAATRLPCALILVACAVLVWLPCASAENAVAFSTKLSNGYVRKKLPDGSFKVETYAFGEGDDWGGARVDASMDRMKFMDVARVIAVPLAARNYLPSPDQKTTDLLIMVYWGTTRAPEHASDTNTLQMAQDAERIQNQAAQATNDALGHEGAAHGNPNDAKVAKINQASADADFRAALEGLQAEDQRRENDDAKTVALLGFDSWWLKTEQASGGGERALRKKDMLDELEEDRYFVVLMAYDFQAMTKKRSKLLWEAHISIREHSNEFDKRLLAMVTEASPFFGADSRGLQHQVLPEGNVEVGPVRSLGVVDGK